MKDFNYEIEYLGGHPNWSVNAKAYLRINSRNQSVVIFNRGFASEGKLVEIPKNKIVSVDFEEKKSRSIGKAAAGAIIGGILTGGIGLLAGGAIGASAKNKSQLYLTIDHNGMHFQVILKTGSDTNHIYGEICSLFAD